MKTMLQEVTIVQEHEHNGDKPMVGKLQYLMLMMREVDPQVVRIMDQEIQESGEEDQAYTQS